MIIHVPASIAFVNQLQNILNISNLFLCQTHNLHTKDDI